MADIELLISKLNVDGKVYNVKDAWAREQISTLNTFTKFLGVTSDALSDGSTTNPVTISGETITAKTGDIVMYNPAKGQSLEFIWNGTTWQEFGSTGSLGDLAFENISNITVSATGTASAQAFTGTAVTLSHTITDSSVTGSGNYDKTTSASFTYEGVTGATTGGAVELATKSVSVMTSAGSATNGSAAVLSYTNSTANFLSSVKSAGTVASISDGFVTAGSDASLTGGSVASFTQGTKAQWSASVDNETLSFSFSANGDDTFTPNALQSLNGGKATVIDTTKFNGGVMPTFNSGSADVSTIASWTTNTPTAVTLPAFESTTVATGTVTKFTNPTVSVEEKSGNATLGHTSTSIDITGAATIAISDHTFTPEGTNAASSVSVSGTIAKKS